MSLFFDELFFAANNVNPEFFLKATISKPVTNLKPGQIAGGPYINLEYNIYWKDTNLVPSYKAFDTILTRDSFVNEETKETIQLDRQYTGWKYTRWHSKVYDEKTTYNSMYCYKAANPELFAVMSFLETARFAALGRLAKDLNAKMDANIKLTKEEMLISDVVCGRFFKDKVPSCIETQYIDQSGTLMNLKDQKIALKCDFSTWPYGPRRNTTKSRFLVLKNEEELAINPSSRTKKILVDDKVNKPIDVLPKSGFVTGSIHYPGKMYFNKGMIKIGPFVGLVIIDPIEVAGALSSEEEEMEKAYNDAADVMDQVSMSYGRNGQNGQYGQYGQNSQNAQYSQNGQGMQVPVDSFDDELDGLSSYRH